MRKSQNIKNRKIKPIESPNDALVAKPTTLDARNNSSQFLELKSARKIQDSPESKSTKVQNSKLRKKLAK